MISHGSEGPGPHVTHLFDTSSCLSLSPGPPWDPNNQVVQGPLPAWVGSKPGQGWGHLPGAELGAGCLLASSEVRMQVNPRARSHLGRGVRWTVYRSIVGKALRDQGTGRPVLCISASLCPWSPELEQVSPWEEEPQCREGTYIAPSCGNPSSCCPH